MIPSPRAPSTALGDEACRLPTLPLWLEAEHAELLDLEHSYAATFGELRIPT
jgi:hypothetical protein